MTDTPSFETIYAGLKEELQKTDAGRARARRNGLIWLIGGLAVTAIATLVLLSTSLWPYVAVFGLIISLWLASRPMRRIADGVKRPVVEAVVRQAGMSYQAGGFAPAGTAEAHKVMFPDVNERRYSDCFTGEQDGRAFAIYEADLSREANNMSREIFKGQIYWFRRKAPVGEIAMVGDRGFLKMFKPGKGLNLVKLPEDAAFEKVFDVYASNEAEARAVLSPEIRHRILQTGGMASAHLMGEEVLVAIDGKDLFEASLGKKVTMEESARRIYDDVQACRSRLAELMAIFG